MNSFGSSESPLRGLVRSEMWTSRVPIHAALLAVVCRRRPKPLNPETPSSSSEFKSEEHGETQSGFNLEKPSFLQCH